MSFPKQKTRHRIFGIIPNIRNKVEFELRESCRQINDRKWHSIKLIQCHLRSSIFGALTRSKSTLFLIFGITCFLLCLFGCTSRNVEKKILRLAIQNAPLTLDPRKSSDFISSTMVALLYEGLTRCKEGQEIELALARKVTISADQKTYTFSLRPSYWSNGEQITAHDFVRSWTQVLDPTTCPSPSAYLLYPILNGEKFAKNEASANSLGLIALNDTTFQVTLERPTPHFLALTAFPLLFPAHASLKDEPFPSITNGPFILSKKTAHVDLEMIPNPLYWNPHLSSLDAIHIFIIPSEATALHLFQAGELDWIGAPLINLSPDVIEALQGDARLSFHPWAASTFCSFNTQLPPFSNLHLRRAFSLAIDREKIAKELTSSGSLPAHRASPPHLLDGPPLYFFDPDKAIQELKIALEELLFLPPITLAFRAGQTEKRIAQTLQAEWKKTLGIEVDLLQLDAKTYGQSIQQGSYLIALTSWIAQYHDPLNLLERFKDASSPKNYPKWAPLAYKTLLEEAEKLPLGPKRDELLRQAEEYMASKAPIAPLYHWNSPCLTQQTIQSLPYTANGGILFERALFLQKIVD